MVSSDQSKTRCILWSGERSWADFIQTPPKLLKVRRSEIPLKMSLSTSGHQEMKPLSPVLGSQPGNPTPQPAQTTWRFASKKVCGNLPWSRQSNSWLVNIPANGTAGVHIWPWIKTYDTIFGWMNIHLPAVLMFTRGRGFWPITICSHTLWPIWAKIFNWDAGRSLSCS